MKAGPSDSGEETQHNTRLLTVELQASAWGTGLDWDRAGRQTLMTRRGFTDSSDGGPVNRLSVRSFPQDQQSIYSDRLRSQSRNMARSAECSEALRPAKVQETVRKDNKHMQ